MWAPPKSQYVNEDNFVTSVFLFTFKTLFLTSLGTNFGHVKQAIEQCWVSSASLCSLWEAPTGIFAIHSTPEWFLSVHWCDFHHKFRSKNPCTISMTCSPLPPPTPASLPVLVTLRTWCGLMAGVGGTPCEKGGSVGKSQTKSVRREEVAWLRYVQMMNTCVESGSESN